MTHVADKAAPETRWLTDAGGSGSGARAIRSVSRGDSMAACYQGRTDSVDAGGGGGERGGGRGGEWGMVN